MLIEIRPEDSYAHELPAIGFRLETGEPGFFGEPFDSPGTYLNLFGPVGGRVSFCVNPAKEPESDAAAVEREARRQLGNQVKYITVAEHAHVAIAGASRPAITYTRGAGIFGEAWCVTLVGTPAGSLLVEACIHWPGKHPPRCADVVESPYLRDLIQSFVLLVDTKPHSAGPRRPGDPLTAGLCTPLSRDQLLALWPEGLIPAIFDAPQPSRGIGTTRLACTWHLEAHGVPRVALERCIDAWRSAINGLPAGAVPPDRLVRLEFELTAETQEAPMLRRWMTALLAWATSTAALTRIWEFLGDVSHIWSDLASDERERPSDPDRTVAARPATPRPATARPATPRPATARSDLLTLDPEPLMDLVFSPRGPSSDLDRVGIALVEQLRAAYVPIEALELCMVAFSYALEGLPPVCRVPADRLAHLDRALDQESFAYDTLARWMSALRSRISTVANLDVAIQLLFRARTTWALTEGLGPRTPADGEPSAA
jgi:hypothetical protein